MSQATCADENDEITQQLEDELSSQVDLMKKAIHHVMLNAKLDECFGILDQIQRAYRNYNQEYLKIVRKYPGTMNTFFDEFENDICYLFRLWPESRREEVKEKFEAETQQKQAQLEAEALAQWEAKRVAEERLREEELKKAGKPPAKQPAGKGAAPGKKEAPG